MVPINVFLDTNVLVDFFTDRMKDGYARKVLLIGKTGQYRMCVSMLTAVNVIYVLHKGGLTLAPEDIESVCTVLGQRLEQWRTACGLTVMPDFEDALQTACALDNECRIVISRDRHYRNCPLKVLSPAEFVKEVIH